MDLRQVLKKNVKGGKGHKEANLIIAMLCLKICPRENSRSSLPSESPKPVTCSKNELAVNCDEGLRKDELLHSTARVNPDGDNDQERKGKSAPGPERWLDMQGASHQLIT